MTTPTETRAARLPVQFDVERLRADLRSVTTATRTPQPGPYHDGSWAGLALVQTRGEQSAQPEFASLHRYLPTPLLAETPYFAEVLDAIPGCKQVVRLLWLPAGRSIDRHYDYDCSFQYGVLRLHVPIVTHSDVDLRIGGLRMDWKEGELWYGDFRSEHSVVNGSPVDRVHLVVDVEVGDELLGLFPPELVAHHESNGGITRRPEFVQLDAEALARAACRFRVDGAVLPLLKYGTLPELMGGAEAALVARDGELVVEFDGTPTFGLDPVSPTEFVVRGLGAGVRLRLEHGSDGRVSSVTLVTRGVPPNLMCARVGRFTENTRFDDRETALPLLRG